MSEVESNKMPMIVYILYLAGILFPLLSIIGVIMAYVNRGNASEIEQSHYTWQIRTFWISFLASIISALLTIILIGWLLLFGLLIWWIVRCIQGLNLFNKGEGVEKVNSWLFA